MKNLTEVIFLLDASGSMYSLAKDTIGGFNSFVEEQKKLDGEMIINTVLFNHRYEMLHDCKDIQEIEPMTAEQYSAGGGTALLDAVGKSITEVSQRIDKMEKAYRPENIIVVITTDGEENNSEEYKLSDIKQIIEDKKKDGWGFIFMGADIDSFGAGGSMGVGSGSTINYEKSSVGTTALYASLSAEIGNCRGVVGYTGSMGYAGNLGKTYATELEKAKSNK